MHVAALARSVGIAPLLRLYCGAIMASCDAALSSAAFASTMLVSAVPRVADKWLQLSEEFRTAVAVKGLATVVVFRSAIDGEFEEMAELVEELGGFPEDVPIALEIWEDIEQVARTELRRLAHTPTPTVVAAAIVSGRQRAAAAASFALDSAPSGEPTDRHAVRRGLLEAGAALTDWPSNLKRSSPRRRSKCTCYSRGEHSGALGSCTQR